MDNHLDSDMDSLIDLLPRYQRCKSAGSHSLACDLCSAVTKFGARDVMSCAGDQLLFGPIYSFVRFRSFLITPDIDIIVSLVPAMISFRRPAISACVGRDTEIALWWLVPLSTSPARQPASQPMPCSMGARNSSNKNNIMLSPSPWQYRDVSLRLSLCPPSQSQSLAVNQISCAASIVHF